MNEIIACMHYLLVYVAEMGYQKQDALTYLSAEPVAIGTIVSVPFGRKRVPGIVVGESSKPLFEVKALHEVLHPTPLPHTSVQLHEWFGTYYPSGSGARTSLFVPTGLETTHRLHRDILPRTKDTLPPLTNEQQRALATIETSQKHSFLLHGETGSGKTRLYLERTREVLAANRSALILTPEISLVPQLAETFAAHFGDKVVVLHSGLGKAKRNLHWLHILTAQEPLVVIGTRSALFAPLKAVGLVVVDEMHEPAYKHEQIPHYHALRVAAKLASIHGAEIIYGSATPPVVEYYIAEQTNTPILRLSATAKSTQPVSTHIVDMRKAELFSRHRQLSDQLLDAIEQRIRKGEQSLLFLNRRGTARLVLCQACGWQALCPRCDIPLVYHGDAHRMRCHTCGYHESPPLACPQCASDNIVYRSMGTKALADDIVRLFPHASVKRFDTDNTAAEKLAKHFDDVKSGAVDILVGTQLLGKGLDLPKLSLVGIVNAETSLGMPDFSSSERNYQLLHQAIGRVGRGHTEGTVILQSFQPENPLLQAALSQQWHTLYQHELTERQTYQFPPFVYLLKLTIARKTSAAAQGFAEKLYRAIAQMGLAVSANEPTPSFYERTHGNYQWQLVIKSKRREQLVQLIERLPKGDYSYDIDPTNLL